MGWFNSLGPGIAPPDRGIVGEDELETLRKRAEQAGQLTSLGAEPGMAQRWSGVPEGPPISTPAQIDSFFDSWEAEGRAAQPGKLFSNPGVEEERRALDLDAEVEAEAARHRPSYQQQLQGIETLDVPGRDIGLGMDAPPSGLGQVPAPRASSAPARDLSFMSQAEFRQGIEQQRQQGEARRQQGLEADYARGLQRLEDGPMPGFEYGPDKSLAAVTGREIGGAGLRSGDGVTSGLDVLDRPDGSSVYRSQADDSIYATSARRANEAELAGLRAGAFNASPGADPQAAALMRLAGAGSGGGHIMQGVEGPDVSQATLEHAMAQRAAQAQLSGMESQARQQSAQADAAERDPLGIERYRAQQAIQDARWAAQNQGRRDVSLADDQFRAKQQETLAAQRDKARQDYIDNRRALEEQIAQYPVDLPPGSPEAAYVAQLQRELDRLNQNAELQLRARID